MHSQKNGQIYVITAIIVCIAFFMVIATYRTREQIPETGLDEKPILRELPFGLDAISDTMTEAQFQAIDKNISSYYRQHGKIVYVIYFVFHNESLIVYNGFPQSSVLVCETDQTTIGPGSLHQFSTLSFFQGQVNGTEMLLSTQRCNLTVFADEEHMHDVVYEFEFDRTMLSGSKGLVWLEDSDGVHVERFFS